MERGRRCSARWMWVLVLEWSAFHEVLLKPAAGSLCRCSFFREPACTALIITDQQQAVLILHAPEHRSPGSLALSCERETNCESFIPILATSQTGFAAYGLFLRLSGLISKLLGARNSAGLRYDLCLYIACFGWCLHTLSDVTNSSYYSVWTFWFQAPSLSAWNKLI